MNYRRIIFRKGNEYMLFKTDDIAYFFLENKTCYLMERNQGLKYMIPKSLRDLTRGLNQEEFYRINKKYLVHINAVRKFKLCIAGKIEVELYPATREKVFINQIKMQDFRKWIATGMQRQEENQMIDDALKSEMLNFGGR
ncbi:MAG: LytTR family DNA-binding domain-containing protein [Puia sp.]